jgi:hypothetical protein
MTTSITRSGGYIYELINSYGIDVKVELSDKITIEKYNGILTKKYITTIE